MAPKLVDRELERLVCVSMAHTIDGTSRKVVDLVTLDDFDHTDTRRAFAACEALVAERDGWVGGPEVVAKKLGITLPEWWRFAEGIVWVSSSDLIRSAEALSDLAAKRRGMKTAEALRQMIVSGVPVDDWVAATLDHLEGIRSVVPERDLPATAVDVMARPDQDHEYNWLVPGWLEARDRVMLTGAEGLGKMTIMRQWGVQLSAGIHPWTGEPIRPLRVVQLDLQDGQARNEREFRHIFQRSRTTPMARLFIESWSGTLNILRSQRDRRALESLIRSTRPEVFLVGPVYRLAKTSDRKESATAQGICDFIDVISNRYDIAVVMEAHSPNAPASGPRTTRPYGGVEFVHWPDAGVGMVRDGDHGVKLNEWRGNRDRDAKVWPRRIVEGEYWPWVPRGSSVPALWPRQQSRPVPADQGGPEDDETPQQGEMGEEIF